MFSVMTKSLVLSQGVEKYTFIWTWLCVVTDFFGVFFILIWVFYTNDNIHGNFFGYFNIFGAIWLWKFAISTLLPVTLALIAFFCFGYFVMCCLACYDPHGRNALSERCEACSIWTCFGMISNLHQNNMMI